MVDAYLDQVRRMLADADAGEREELVTTVREHIEESLAQLDRPATTADVREILDKLGPVDDLVAVWERGGEQRLARSEDREGLGVGIVAVTLGVIALTSIIINPFLSLALGVAAVIVGLIGTRRHPARRVLYRVGASLGALGLAASMVVLATSVAVRDQPMDNEPAVPAEPPDG
ncbi:HAAS signaling domain-containing protein [Georgenia yuyongxinii]